MTEIQEIRAAAALAAASMNHPRALEFLGAFEVYIETGELPPSLPTMGRGADQHLRDARSSVVRAGPDLSEATDAVE